jgi:hypothetical protein
MCRVKLDGVGFYTTQKSGISCDTHSTVPTMKGLFENVIPIEVGIYVYVKALGSLCHKRHSPSTLKKNQHKIL